MCWVFSLLKVHTFWDLKIILQIGNNLIKFKYLYIFTQLRNFLISKKY